MKEIKTNAMRILDSHHICYNCYHYEVEVEDENNLGIKVARLINKPVDMLFKTLVTIGQSKNYYVFVIPVAMNLDLKKAAQSVSEKNVQMIHVKDINQVTGYIRGGCSPVGMKKQYTTVFDESVELFDKIIISAGKIGTQMEVDVQQLIDLVNGKVANITF